MDGLKPCPFCGGSARQDYAVINVKYEGLVTFTKVICSRCKAQTNIFRVDEWAFDAWNQRTEKGEHT